MADDRLSRQIRLILEAHDAAAAEHEAQAAVIEERGVRIVDVLQVGHDQGDDGAFNFRCVDWRTRNTLLAGHGTRTAIEGLMRRKAGELGEEWLEIGDVPVVATDGERSGEEELAPGVADGVPASLVQPLIEWVGESASLAELVQVTGWPVHRVTRMLRELKPAPLSDI